MRVFISWSGDASHRLALALRDLIRGTVPAAEPWVSSEDIEPGSRWSRVLAAQLEASSFGLVCVVPANLEAPWIHFEAGAIAKSVSEGRLIPVLCGVSPRALPGPLAQFQAIDCSQAGLHKLVGQLNANVPDPDPETELRLRLDAILSSFEKTTAGIASLPTPSPKGPETGSQLTIDMGYLAQWKHEQIIIRNVGDDVAEGIELFADGVPIREASYVVDNQEFVDRLRPDEEFGVKIALTMTSPERADVAAAWKGASGEARRTEKLLTLI